MRTIIGLTGEMASGKDAVAKYLVFKYNASPHKFSAVIRNILRKLCLPESRENMNELSAILRKSFEEDIFSRMMCESVENDNHSCIVIDGIRRLGDMKDLKDLPGFKFIFIESDLKKRYERIIKREENPCDKNKSFEEFKKEHLGDAETQIAGLKQYADYVVENNGTLEDLYKKIDEIISKQNI
ncbi:MAG: AAA family ATPase [Patescibacteria group bacterium]